MTEDPPARRKRGRPRDPRVEDAALGAARTLLLEKGISGCTIAAVASDAGVGKGTIYLRWPDKESLIVDALADGGLSVMAEVGTMDPPDTGSVRGDLVQLAGTVGDLMASERGALIAATVGELPRYPKLQALYDERVLEPVVATIGTILDRGRKRGEVRKGIDASMFADLLFGPMLTRRMLWQGELPKGFVKKTIEVLMEGIGPK